MLQAQSTPLGVTGGIEWVEWVERIDVERHATRPEALATETTAILDERPAFNVASRSRGEGEQALRDWMQRHSVLAPPPEPGTVGFCTRCGSCRRETCREHITT